VETIFVTPGITPIAGGATHPKAVGFFIEMEEGWLKLHRKILKHWIWSDAYYLRAWIYCLLRANHEKKRVMIKGQITDINRGEFVTSLHKFSKETELSVQQVRTFFKLLQKDKMISKNPTKKVTKLTICNYDSYNDVQQGEQQSDNKHPTHHQQRTRTNKNEKNIIYNQIIDHFNKTLNRQIKLTTSRKQQINGRIKEGYSLEDFKKVIDTMNRKWRGTEMEQYLTPDTLFRASKFPKYREMADNNKSINHHNLEAN